MTINELVLEILSRMNGDYDPLEYDATMKTNIESAYGAVLLALKTAGLIGVYTVDAGTTYNTTASLAFGHVKVYVTITDVVTGDVAAYTTKFGGSAVNANSA